MDPALEAVSPSEQILVERSQDSVQVTKNRLQRQSLTAQTPSEDELEDDEEAIVPDPRQDSLAQAHRRLGHTAAPPSKQRKKPKTRFAAESEEAGVGLDEGTRAERQERKSIGRRISEALHLKKMGQQSTPPAAVEDSLPSVHVKFSQKPQLIE